MANKIDLEKEPLTMTRKEIEDKYGKKYGVAWDKIQKENQEMEEQLESMLSQIEELDDKQKANQEKFKKIELMQNYYNERKYKKSLELARELIAMGVSFAKVLLGTLYMHGQSVKKDTSKALKIWTEAAKEGVPNAQFNLGITYINGTIKNIPLDVSKSIKYLEMASNNNHPEACFTLGQIYSDGKHIESDHSLAWKYMSLAESLGNEDAIRWRESMEKYMNSMQIIIDIAKSSDQSKKKLSDLEKRFKKGDVLEEHYNTCKNKLMSEV